MVTGALAPQGGPHVTAYVNDGTLQKLIRGAGKCKACRIQLSPDEIAQNKIEGTGIMSGARKALSGFANSKAGKSLAKQGAKAATKLAKKELEKRGVSNPLVDQLIDAGANEAVKAATGGGFMDSALKAGKKFAGSKAGKSLAKQGSKALTKLAKKELDKRGVSNPLVDQLIDAGANEAVKAATGGRLIDKLTPAQIEAMKVHKGAVFGKGNMLTSALKAGKKFAGSKAGKSLINQGKKALTNAAKKELNKRGVSNPLVDQLIDAGANEGVKMATGGSMTKEELVDYINGGKLFSLYRTKWGRKHHGLLKGLDNVGRVALPIVASAAGPEAAVAAELAMAANDASGAGLYGSGLYGGVHYGRGLYAMQGGNIGSRLSGPTNVGAGGNLLGRHPALMSQASSANWHFNTQFPIELQEPGVFGVR